MSKNIKNLKFLYGMKKLFILVFVLGLLVTNVAFAQMSNMSNKVTPTSNVSSKDVVVVATVNIKNTKIISSTDRDYKISFDISNTDGVQAQVKYSVFLTKTNKSKIEDLVDQKVFGELLSLDKNSSINKIVDYTVPDSAASGTYHLWISSNNQNSLPFGTTFVGDIKVSSTDKSNTIEIVKDSCMKQRLDTYDKAQILAYEADPEAFQKSLKSFNLTCEVINNLPNEISVIPVAETRKISSFGESVEQTGGSKEPIILKKGINKIVIELPIATKTQTYDVIFFLESLDKKVRSNTYIRNYFFTGLSGSIDNVVLDKPIYNSGDNASLRIFSKYSGNKGTTTVLSTTLSIQIANDKNVLCSDKIEKENINNLFEMNINIPINKYCVNPVANVVLSATLSNGEVEVLDKQEYKVITPESYLNKFKTLYIVLLVLLTAVIAFVGFRYKKRTALNLLIVIVVGILFGFANHASADTYYLYEGTTTAPQWSQKYYITMPKEVFPGDKITITGGIDNAATTFSSDIKSVMGDLSSPQFNGTDFGGYLYPTSPRLLTAPTTLGNYMLKVNTAWSVMVYNTCDPIHTCGETETKNIQTRDVGYFKVITKPNASISLTSSNGGTTQATAFTKGNNNTVINWNVTGAISCNVLKDGVNVAGPFTENVTETVQGECTPALCCDGFMWESCYYSEYPYDFKPYTHVEVWDCPTYEVLTQVLNPNTSGSIPVSNINKNTTFEVSCDVGTTIPLKQSLTLYVKSLPVGANAPQVPGKCSIQGWACDTDSLATPLTIELSTSTVGKKLNTSLAGLSDSQFDPAVTTACGTGNNHGFSMGVYDTSIADGNPHTIIIKALDVDYLGTPTGASTTWTTSLTCADTSTGVSIKALPEQIKKNTSTLIQWTAPLATQCVIKKENNEIYNGPLGNSSIDSGVLNANTTFSAKCFNGSSPLPEDQVTVGVYVKPPVINCNQTVICSQGDPIEWESGDASGCSLINTASNGAVTVLSTDPTVQTTVSGLIGDTLSLQCTSAVGFIMPSIKISTAPVSTICKVTQPVDVKHLDANILYKDRKTTFAFLSANPTSVTWKVNGSTISGNTNIFTTVGTKTITGSGIVAGSAVSCEKTVNIKLDPGIGSGEI